MILRKRIVGQPCQWPAVIMRERGSEIRYLLAAADRFALTKKVLDKQDIVQWFVVLQGELWLGTCNLTLFYIARARSLAAMDFKADAMSSLDMFYANAHYFNEYMKYTASLQNPPHPECNGR